MTKRQYNNDVFMIKGYYVSIERLGYTAAGKSRYRVGIIKPAGSYLHEVVYHTTSHESEKAEAERVVAYYEESIKA